jgi:hypothetical protein
MSKNVYRFRRVKWGDPRPKLKVLVEDLKRAPWIERLSSKAFAGMVGGLALIVFFAAITITHLLGR